MNEENGFALKPEMYSQIEWYQMFLSMLKECKRIQQENEQLKEENNKKLDRLINLEEKILDYQGRLSLIKITIKNFLCTEEYINVDGKAIADNYEKILEILEGGNNE